MVFPVYRIKVKKPDAKAPGFPTNGGGLPPLLFPVLFEQDELTDLLKSLTF